MAIISFETRKPDYTFNAEKLYKKLTNFSNLVFDYQNCQKAKVAITASLVEINLANNITKMLRNVGPTESLKPFFDKYINAKETVINEGIDLRPYIQNMTDKNKKEIKEKLAEINKKYFSTIQSNVNYLGNKLSPYETEVINEIAEYFELSPKGFHLGIRYCDNVKNNMKYSTKEHSKLFLQLFKMCSNSLKTQSLLSTITGENGEEFMYKNIDNVKNDLPFSYFQIPSYHSIALLESEKTEKNVIQFNDFAKNTNSLQHSDSAEHIASEIISMAKYIFIYSSEIYENNGGSPDVADLFEIETHMAANDKAEALQRSYSLKEMQKSMQDLFNKADRKTRKNAYELLVQKKSDAIKHENKSIEHFNKFCSIVSENLNDDVSMGEFNTDLVGARGIFNSAFKLMDFLTRNRPAETLVQSQVANRINFARES